MRNGSSGKLDALNIIAHGVGAHDMGAHDVGQELGQGVLKIS